MKKGFVYFIGAPDSEVVKIGYSLDPASRIRQIQSGNATDLKVLHQFPGDRDTERYLHSLFAGFRVRGEWFTAAEDILDFARELELSHLAHVLWLEGFVVWPPFEDHQREVVDRFDRTPLTKRQIDHVFEVLWPPYEDRDNVKPRTKIWTVPEVLAALS